MDNAPREPPSRRNSLAQHHQAQHHHDTSEDHHRRQGQGHVAERGRRMSQASKDTSNAGHSLLSHPTELSRRPSQHSHITEDNYEKHRRISLYSLKTTTHRGYGRSRGLHRKDHDWQSVATSGDLNPPIEYENTYKLDPDSGFNPERVEAIIKKVLEDNLAGQKYDKNLMGTRCLILSDIIKEKVRQLKLNRFKIVCLVLIGEVKNQSLMVSSRCLWDNSCDNFASYNYSSGNLCAVGMVFAVYQE
ncbi:dynein light chain Tctex-type protein 2-like [Physella acuta]|uniref:dynein light chain Tctex-type protein 2-like n=1 Tax=Physella acuta TaxID=109671 RepID=UPI0027DE81AB|nr:dynein light chain Tctex-type protein 2-like [Physella acuta]